MTKFYGLLPWHFDEMTLREVSEYRAQMAKYQAEVERANRGG